MVPPSAAWAQADDDVTVVLLDPDLLAGLCRHGVRVLAHDDALERRGLGAVTLVEGMSIVDLDESPTSSRRGPDRAVWW